MASGDLSTLGANEFSPEPKAYLKNRWILETSEPNSQTGVV